MTKITSPAFLLKQELEMLRVLIEERKCVEFFFVWVMFVNIRRLKEYY